MKLRDRVALITGGASGIGQATAILFAKEGASVAVVDVDEVRGKEIINTIRNNGGKAIFIRADVSKAKDAERMVKETVATFGKLNILFNNAGIMGVIAPLVGTSEEDWDRVMDINVKGVYLGSKYAIPEMIKNGGGVIINTGSGAGISATPNSTVYCTSKAAVIMLTKTIAVDYGQKGIRANCVCPGLVETDFYRIWSKEDRRQLYESSAKGSLVGRTGKPEDIARAALYLASEDSSFMQGAALVIDGGFTAQ